MNTFNNIINFIKSKFPNQEFIPLHEPRFLGNEKKYLNECIDSTFVSSVGKFVDEFELKLAEFTGANYAVACVNGTSGLHMALLIADVKPNEEVLTQALSFIATANAISYSGANSVFIDVDKDTLGMSPKALNNFLEKHAELKVDGFSYNKTTGKRIAACVPMHTFGFPCRIDEIAVLCKKWNIPLIEDAAESIGSYYQNQHTGTFGKIGVFSFNGNKTITCGGGGAIITNDEALAKKAKHLTTQAKVPHAWEFVHDHIGYNYRMPNINAALALAQLEQLDKFIENKRHLANQYADFFSQTNITFVKEAKDSKANYWLNCIVLENKQQRDEFLEISNNNGVMTRPVWELTHRLPMFSNSQTDGLVNSIWLADRLVNIPSSVRV
ncbi:MAG: aminotransferase DegT [Bacteroidetes bacterium HGW-Bacteroidetes-12]|nr:MAG: aminotransferase DegT [Bacteroidetes bacterium HGW-Bacteroidetes-12]